MRRAPFSTNPQVGARGQRTQQRILDAALRVFGERGYHQTSIDNITRIAGCSRVSFYQYFSSKEDVFRHLAVQVARQLNAATDRLEPVTASSDGWDALRAWTARYAEIYHHYRPVFHAFPAATESDPQLTPDSARTARRFATGIQARVSGTVVPARDLDYVVSLLRESLPRVVDDLSALRAASPHAIREEIVLDAFVDVVHRTLFGQDPDVNVHAGRVRRLPKLAFGPVMRAALEQDDAEAAEPQGGPALGALLDAARKVFISRGYHGTRVDDLADAAGVSHGAFYRYFHNKDEIAHLLAAQAMRKVSNTFTEIPDLSAGGASATNALRRWLRAWNRAQLDETAMLRVWTDASLQDDSLSAESAATIDWGRRRLVHFLEPRGFGDAELDALVLLSVIDTFGMRERSAREVDAATQIIERGFLGR